jgi:hypothetical protein
VDDDSGYQELFDAPLELDEQMERAERSGEAIIGDDKIRLLLRENRIALRKGKSVQVRMLEKLGENLALYDVPLMCVVHSHPECRFRWARLMVDLGPTAGARIEDMAPREVRGTSPIELKTTVGGTLKFEAIPKILSGGLKRETTMSHTIYFPEILSSGPGFTKGYWDFNATTDEFLHANRELRLLVNASSERPLLCRFNLRAKVGLAGLGGLIPLLTRSGAIDATYRLN